jgi:subtilisin family serine protease
VAVVDTGVQADHPMLQGRVLQGYDFVGGDADASDDNGHGTAVAGIVAANCPVCRILPVKVLDAHGVTTSWSTFAAGVTWAADHGAQVIDLSVGGPRALDVLGAAVAHALDEGVIVVAAAGNDGTGETFYPAAYGGVVSVAGIDQNGARYSWSNHGSWVSTEGPGCAATTWIGSGYASDFCGTSTAAPFVAAVAGLARAYDPDLTPKGFLAALAATAAAPAGDTAASGQPDARRLLLALAPQQAKPAPKAQRKPRVAARRRRGPVARPH